ncbi:hypothetical protein BG32_05855 [Mesotoga sp. HF07.pep.5.2.highcov]|jgi:hypothetical protein|uniref:hypothetical protein n=1 Tax=unclassified Mesotoga TaxID=1184398 RepID=UPI000C18DB7B|nr:MULTISPECIES: hypothetical protein [unclassified Mesotoga]PIJ63596.1 hypothetical protein V513_00400 [Mesotoga sp. H07.pep.5.3]RLL90547.1 hypothetical protein BG32_05855 [Mesotoga sp. HF07.pep.5.2.highcov]
MGFAARRSRRPKIGLIRNNFIRASVLLGIVTPVSIYGITKFFGARERLEGFGWLLIMLIAVWILVAVIWVLSLRVYFEARKQIVRSRRGFRTGNLKPSRMILNRSQVSSIRTKST